MVLDLLTVTLSPNDNIQPTKYTTDHLHQQKKAHKKTKRKVFNNYAMSAIHAN